MHAASLDTERTAAILIMSSSCRWCMSSSFNIVKLFYKSNSRRLSLKLVKQNQKSNILNISMSNTNCIGGF